ncbi:ribonuclease Y [Candidatus Parcubacteria bacterium]|nr:ribonuclease Y [Patescibacteria group bacterium]MBU4466867.1 ribonuclease Y [Patescibacteria group bacterium]MCG2688629.1 ribonuclease Y [Candidatus Parcubacteria bacterium]
MNQLLYIVIVVLSLTAGAVLGYFARQSIAKKKIGSIEEKLEKMISQARVEAETILSEAKAKSQKLIETTQGDTERRHQEIFKAEGLLLKRENLLDQRKTQLENREADFLGKVEKLREVKKNIEELEEKTKQELARVARLSVQDAKEELFKKVENDSQREILEKMRRLEEGGRDQFENKAKEILTLAIQKQAMSQAQEITTTTVALPNDDIKGRIIGKEGRNIRTLERLTGVEVIIDETPQALVISGFDPIRRQIAKTALEKLIQDGRIQPARIEDEVAKAEAEINKQVKDAGETAVYETGIIGLDPKLVQILGRLKFRTSYGQNVLLHSMEVSFLAAALAAEVGANIKLAKKAGLLHDIGKAVDQQVEGSHVDIGVKILEKFGVEKEIISAMKSHHEDYPYESIESMLVQAADQISGARPGARKDNAENYLKRLEDLEKIATNFEGVEKAWALQAGREIRVFVRPEQIDDLSARKMAKDIASKIQEELRYPGEIKVNLIRELRVTEHAR